MYGMYLFSLKNASKEKYLSCFLVLSVLSKVPGVGHDQENCRINELMNELKNLTKHPSSQAGLTITKRRNKEKT